MTDNPNVVREQLEADVLIIGAGPAGLACALHLANLIEKHTRSEEISGALRGKYLRPGKGPRNRRAPAFRRDHGPARPRANWCRISKRPRRSIRPSPATRPTTSPNPVRCKLPITPPPLQNHGNYVVSLNKLVKWLGGLVEKKGVNVFTQFAGRELLYDKNGIAGVLTEDKGVDKDGKPKDNFTPGYELRAKVTVLAEGPRGSLTKELVDD